MRSGVEKDVLFTVYISEERAIGDDMDRCAFGEKAPEESGGRYRYWRFRRWVLFLFLYFFGDFFPKLNFGLLG